MAVKNLNRHMTIIVFLWMGFCAIFAPSFSYAKAKIDFVLDIDGVLIDDWSGGKPGIHDIVVTAVGLNYRLADGVGAFLQSLSDIPNARISIFSSNLEDRNLEVLKKIFLPDGRSAFQLVEGRIFSRANLYKDPESHRLVKDLNLVSPDIDLNNAILIDDQEGYASNSQKRNLLRVRNSQLSTFYRINSNGEIASIVKMFLESGSGWSAKEYANSFVTDRNKLAWARGLIDIAGETAVREGISIVEALHQIQYPNGEDFNFRLSEDLSIYRKGVQALKKVKGYVFTSLHGKVGLCGDALSGHSKSP